MTAVLAIVTDGNEVSILSFAYVELFHGRVVFPFVTIEFAFRAMFDGSGFH